MTPTDTRRRVLIIGDSSALPGHGNAYEDTWVYLLKESYPAWDFIANCEGATTTEALGQPGARGADCMALYRPDAVVLQLGMVDCAPRLFKRGSLAEAFVRRLPACLARPVVALKKRWRGRALRNAYVSPADFERNLRVYLERCRAAGVKGVIAVAIAWPDDRMVAANRLVRNAVARYNAILASLAGSDGLLRCVDPLSAAQAGPHLYDSDGYHPNPAGHRKVFEALRDELDRLFGGQSDCAS